MKNTDAVEAAINYAADLMKATNDLLEARAAHRAAQNNGSNINKVIDAQVKVLKAELELEMLTPRKSDPVPEIGLRVISDETFPVTRRSAGIHPDDPRKGQADGINAMRRIPE